VRAALRQLPPEVWALGAVSLLTDAAADMIYPLLPQLLLLVGGGAVALGTLEGTAELVSSLVKAWAGRAAVRGGKQGRYVIAGYALASFSRPCLALITAPWQAVFFRSLDRLGKGLRSAPRDMIIARVTPEERRGLAFGVHRGMDNLGAVFGPLIAWLLLSGAHLDVRTVVGLAVIPGIFATIAATWAVRKETNAEPVPVERDEHAEVPRSVKKLLAVTAIFALSASADSFLLMRLQDLGLPIAWVPIAWVTLQLGKSLLNVPGGALADRLGPRRVLLASWIVYAVAYAAFAFAANWPIFWAIFAVYAIHYGLGEGAEKSLVTSMVPKRARGTAFGLQHAVHGFALLPANLLFGALYTKKPIYAFGFSASLATIAAIALLSTVPEPTPST
jgi:MFS family permease